MYIGNSRNSTLHVAWGGPNELGIYGMSGNVFEWCWDYTGDYPNYPQTNPTGPVVGDNRVIRGGSWMDQASCCTVSYRTSEIPIAGYAFLGFRIVAR